jgi:hypothetical protein
VWSNFHEKIPILCGHCAASTQFVNGQKFVRKEILKHGVKNKNKDTKQVFMKLKSASPTPPIRGSQRDVVYLGWPMAPSYMCPNAGGRGLANVSIVSAAANPTVANVLQYIGCEFLLLLLVYLLNVAGFSTTVLLLHYLC